MTNACDWVSVLDRAVSAQPAAGLSEIQDTYDIQNIYDFQDISVANVARTLLPQKSAERCNTVQLRVVPVDTPGNRSKAFVTRA